MFLTCQTWQVIGSTFQKDSEEDTGGLTVGGREERESCMHTSWILFCCDTCGTSKGMYLEGSWVHRTESHVRFG